jgi:hypothetical protein
MTSYHGPSWGALNYIKMSNKTLDSLPQWCKVERMKRKWTKKIHWDWYMKEDKSEHFSPFSIRWFNLYSLSPQFSLMGNYKLILSYSLWVDLKNRIITLHVLTVTKSTTGFFLLRKKTPLPMTIFFHSLGQRLSLWLSFSQAPLRPEGHILGQFTKAQL